MKDGIIIQARTGSTRLHNKILLPFYNQKRIIDILIENIKLANPGVSIVLATTTLPQDDVLAGVALGNGIRCFRGSEENVLSRFIGAAESYGIERLVRVCSDNPFLQASTFAGMFRAHDTHPVDYVGYAFADGRPAIKSHLGLFSELTTLEALRKVAAKSQERLYIEHVTPYIYMHPDEFSLTLLPLPQELEGRFDLRFTLDTQDDFELLQQLYALFQKEASQSIAALLGLIEAHPEYRIRMLDNIAKNEK